MDKYLKQLAAKLEKIENRNHLDDDGVVRLMSLFRQHLELNNLKQRFPVLQFYCNWTLHDRLDQQSKLLLSQIPQIIQDPNELNPNDRINEAISLQRLRSEILKVLA